MSSTAHSSARGRTLRAGLALAVIAVVGATWRSLGDAGGAPIQEPLAHLAGEAEPAHGPSRITEPTEAASRANVNRAPVGEAAEVPTLPEPPSSGSEAGEVVRAQGGTVRGFVRDRERFAIGNARVHALQQLASDEGTEGAWQEVGAHTRSFADGSFTLDTGKRGTWWLRASAGHAASTLVGPLTSGSADGLTELLIDLAPRGSIVGRVQAASGEALTGRRVDASCGDGEVRTTTTDEAGEYTHADLAPGSWQVRFIEWAEVSSSPSEHTHILAGAPPIPWDCQVRDGATTRFDISVPEPTRVTLRVTGPAASLAMADWAIEANWDQTAQEERTIQARREEDSGLYVLDLVTSGRWRLTSRAKLGEASVSISQVIDFPSGPSDFEWRVPTGAVRGRVVGSEANSVVRCYQTTSDGRFLSASVLTGADGTFHFPVAFAGKLTLGLGTSKRLGEFTLLEDETKDLGELQAPDR